jgi:CubicO group peptidase (beta-lactamase class C family)
LHHLLTHTAGFDESVVGYAARTASDLRPLGEFLAAKLPRRGWAPGDLLSYSNYGYALAGYVVESVAGMPFHEHVRRTVLSPLGMTRSSFEQPMPAELQPDAAVAYRCTMERCISLPPDFRSAYPPGGLVTTAADMSRFLLAQLDSTDDPSPLTEEVRRFMHERQFSHDPALPGLTYGFAEDELAGERALSHAGGASGFSSFVVLVPAKRFGAFLAVNGGGSGFGADVMNLMAEQFLSPSGPALVAPTFAGHVDAPSPVGAYRSTRYAHRGVENLPTLFSGQLHARGTATELNIDGLGSASGTYLRVGPGLWRKAGGTELVGVRTNGRHTTHLFGAPSFFGTRYPAAFERLTWYDEPSLVNEELSYLVMMPLLALAGWPLIVGTQWLVRRWRGGVPPSPRPHNSLFGARVAAVVVALVYSVLAAAFAFGFIAVTTRAAAAGGGDIIFGLSPAQNVLARVPALIIVLASCATALTIVAWRRRWWKLTGQLVMTIVAISAIGFSTLLIHWGYFPTAI